MARGIPFGLDNDVEGSAVPDAALTGGRVLDAHVHLFPERVFEAIWRWFDRHAWGIRYRLHAEAVVEFLTSRGISQMVGLVYAHVPGMSQSLNDHMASLGKAHRDVVIPLGTVLPGEPNMADVVRHALFNLDLAGLKLHCHVQRFAPDDPSLDVIYQLATDANKPILIHAGREPSSPAYGIDTHKLCHVDRIERVLQKFPHLTLVVPHLGFDEFEAYTALLGKYPNLWLDTTMTAAGFFPEKPSSSLFERHADRLIFGTDFPNLPYAWDRELRALSSEKLTVPQRTALFSGNAKRVFLR